METKGGECRFDIAQKALGSVKKRGTERNAVIGIILK